jgi:hypothetical protein
MDGHVAAEISAPEQFLWEHAAPSSLPKETQRMASEEPLGDRRRYQRFRLGLPVNVHVAWRNEPVTVQLIDIGAKGARFRSGSGVLHLDQEAAFGFVSPGQHVCVANGRVVRVGGDGEFVLSVERANAAFHGFLGSLAA